MDRMKSLRCVAAMLMLLAVVPAPAAVRLYGVVFGFTVDRSGSVQSLHVVRILDPASKHPAPIRVPPAYVEAVRKLLVARHPTPTERDGKPVEAFAWYFFDPAQPGKADIGLDPP